MLNSQSRECPFSIQFEEKRYDILNAVCSFIFTISILIIDPALGHLHDNFEPVTLFYVVHTLLNLKNSKFVMIASIAIWLLIFRSSSASTHLFWFTCTILNLHYFARAYIQLSRRRLKPLFYGFSLPIVCLANILLVIGLIFWLLDITNVFCGPGIFLYFLYSVLFTLSIMSCSGQILYECFEDDNLIAMQEQHTCMEQDERENDICSGIRKDDMAKVLCLVIIPILFPTADVSIIGFAGGFFCFLYAMLDMRTRHHDGAYYLASIRGFGGVMWLIGFHWFGTISEHPSSPSSSSVVFGELWHLGCICNLLIIISDLVAMARRSRAKPIFSYLFLWAGLVTNLLNISLIAVGIHSHSHSMVDTIFYIMWVLFFLQPIFLALSLIRGQLVFLIHTSKCDLKGSDEDDPKDAEEGSEMPLVGNQSDDAIM